jgi:hypothetical protein
MTLRFVKTSILTSEDGIDFGTETAVENEETRAARLAAEQAQNRPLYQQLADIKNRKDEEYDENTKKMFAPPKALDEDDVMYFQELDNIKSRAMDAREIREQKELSSFRTAQRIGHIEQNSIPVVPVHKAPVIEKKTIIPTTFIGLLSLLICTFVNLPSCSVKKKKIVGDNKQNVALPMQTNETSVNKDDESNQNKKQKIDDCSSTKVPTGQSSVIITPTPPMSTGLSGLADYGSDSD